MDKKEDSLIIAEIMANAMRDFNSAMKYERDLGIKIGRRTTQIIRFGMVGIVLLIFALFALIYEL